MRALFDVEGPVAIAVDADLAIEVAGHQLVIGRPRLFHAQTGIRDKAQLLQALTAGQGAGRKIMLAPIGGQSYRVHVSEAWVGRESEALEVTTWSLPGLDDSPRG